MRCPICNRPYKRTLDQNSAIHPTIRDVARHLMRNGAKKHPESWWRMYFVAEWGGQEVAEGLDGKLIVMNKHGGTSDLDKAQASDFLDWLIAYGTGIGVEWSETKAKENEE